MKDPLPPGSYYVFVSRAAERPMVHVWPIALDHPLPSIPVPLLEGDADVTLDLQSCFQAIYDAGGFDLVLDYSKALSSRIRPRGLPNACGQPGNDRLSQLESRLQPAEAGTPT
jgi:hypothetical protein